MVGGALDTLVEVCLAEIEDGCGCQALLDEC